MPAGGRIFERSAMSDQETDRALFDVRGCLTAAGLAAFATAPAGAGPPSLAVHVAACARCQQALLGLTDGEGAAVRGARKQAGGRRWLHLGLLLGLMLLAVVALLATLSYFAR
jgi:hypothetical protein